MNMVPSTQGSEAAWLSVFPELDGITDTAWGEAVQAARSMTLPAGMVVVREGDPCQNFLLIVEGTIRVSKTGENGREILLYRTGAGEICILTLSNLLEGNAYSAEVVTEEPVRAVSIPLLYFDQAMARSDAFRRVILSTMSRRLNEMMRLVEQVTFQSLDLRLACLLGQLFGQRNCRVVRMTHQELASELGTTREVVSRLLKVFERMGCVRLHRGQIELLSQEALARLVREESV